MDFVWTNSAIELINKEKCTEKFNNPTLESIVTEKQFTQWKDFMNNQSLTYEIL